MNLESCLIQLGEERRSHFELTAFLNALSEIGNPQYTLKTLVVAGTNGKGTTTLLLSSALKEHCLKVATFLSPHLQKINERFLYNLDSLNSEVLDRYALDLWEVARRHKLSYFEFLTLIFYRWAADTKPDYVVLEVGLGGRLDATNTTSPLATIITNIDWDHSEILGDTLEKILAEKMGILRTGVPLFTGIEQPALLRRVEETCKKMSCPLYFPENTPSLELTNPSPGSEKDAALAYRVLKVMFPKITDGEIRRAFRRVVNPGRFEVVSVQPRVILSGDHNPAGIQCLKETLEREGISKPKILCGFAPDKPFETMHKELSALSSEITLTEISRFHGKYPPAYSKLGRFLAPAPSALETLMKDLKPGDTLLITGSLYLVGELRHKWQKEVTYMAPTQKE